MPLGHAKPPGVPGKGPPSRRPRRVPPSRRPLSQSSPARAPPTPVASVVGAEWARACVRRTPRGKLRWGAVFASSTRLTGKPTGSIHAQDSVLVSLKHQNSFVPWGILSLLGNRKVQPIHTACDMFRLWLGPCEARRAGRSGATAQGQPRAASTRPGHRGVRTEATPGASIRAAPPAQVLQEAAVHKVPSAQEGRGAQWPKGIRPR